MEDLKSSFAPMLTFSSFDSSMDAGGGYYYHSSSADSSPVMGVSQASSSFDSSPGHSPPFYGSFESSGASPQYYMESGSQCLEQYQPAQEFFTTTTTTSNNMSGSQMMMEQQSPKQQQQQVHIPGLNELTRLFNMAAKVEDKLAIQAKINNLLFEHLPMNKRQQQRQQMLMQQQQQQESSQQMTYMLDSNGHQNALITPPLSPNGDNMMFMSKQNPMFAPLKHGAARSGATMQLSPGGHQVLKVEPLSPSMQRQQQQQPLMGRKISQSSFGDASNNSSADSGLLLGGQSPVQGAQNSSKTAGIYFEPSQQQQQQQFNGGQYNGSVSSILVSESASIPESVQLPINGAENQSNNCTELKSMMVAAAAAAAGKPSKNGRGKGKGKGKKSADSRKSAAAASLAGLGLGGGPPVPSQKRTAHLSAEFRYRTKLNDKISKLRSLVGQKVHLSKSAVLTRSIERIVKLQKLTIRLHESNLRLQSLVAKYSGGNAAAAAAAAPSTETQSKAASAPLMSIKELTRSLSVGSGTSLLSGRSGSSSGQFNNSAQATIDIDLAKYIDSQMLSAEVSDHLPATIESTVNNSSSNSSNSSVPSVVSTTANHSLTDEVFDFDQFLDQF